MRTTTVVILALASHVHCRLLPDDLLIGTATSSYHIEGARNIDGENIWDRFVHSRPGQILDGSTGDVSVDSYHKYENDEQALKNLGLQHYRFSISWSRVLPQGHSNYINPNGIAYYNDVIDLLLANGIRPIVTMYHWDLPQPLQDLGGWTNGEVVNWFKDYAGVLYDHFGDRVKLWFTINEPKQVCEGGYGSGAGAPGVEAPGIGDYLCARNVLLAHAAAYRLYKKRKLGLVVDCNWFEPNTATDVNAAERLRQFEFGFYMHPIYYGDFPRVVKQDVANRSRLEGYSKSRLPDLNKQEKDFIRGTADYFGINYYTAFYVQDAVPQPIGSPSADKDVSVETYQDPAWPGSLHVFRSVPWGFRKILKYIKENYGNPPIIVGENGFADNEQSTCDARYAIEIDRVRVKMYTSWSLMDNFEWIGGYMVLFGLHGVNMSDPNLTRVPKLSAAFFKKLLQCRDLPETFC